MTQLTSKNENLSTLTTIKIKHLRSKFNCASSWLSRSERRLLTCVVRNATDWSPVRPDNCHQNHLPFTVVIHSFFPSGLFSHRSQPVLVDNTVEEKANHNLNDLIY